MNPAAPVTTTLCDCGATPNKGGRFGVLQLLPILCKVRRFEAWLADAAAGLAVKQFPQGTRTATDAARAVGCEVGQIVKSLVFVAAGNPVVALVSGANRVDEKRLGAAAGDPVVKADAETARSATGYSIGGVPPFGHATEVPVFMDRDLLGYAVVWAAAGRPDSVFEIEPARLRDLSGATVVDLKGA
jgi:prolyl-tRNA editing enzyme YbaK/EbsC (Cys-tRNA(Pro) deacylase)